MRDEIPLSKIDGRIAIELTNCNPYAIGSNPNEGQFFDVKLFLFQQRGHDGALGDLGLPFLSRKHAISLLIASFAAHTIGITLLDDGERLRIGSNDAILQKVCQSY